MKAKEVRLTVDNVLIICFNDVILKANPFLNDNLT